PRGGDSLREEVAWQPPVGHARRHDAKRVAPLESHTHSVILPRLPHDLSRRLEDAENTTVLLIKNLRELRILRVFVMSRERADRISAPHSPPEPGAPAACGGSRRCLRG